MQDSCKALEDKIRAQREEKREWEMRVDEKAKIIERLGYKIEEREAQMLELERLIQTLQERLSAMESVRAISCETDPFGDATSTSSRPEHGLELQGSDPRATIYSSMEYGEMLETEQDIRHLVQVPFNFAGRSATWKRKLDKAHDRELTDVSYASRGVLATASADGCVKLWAPGGSLFNTSIVGIRAIHSRSVRLCVV